MDRRIQRRHRPSCDGLARRSRGRSRTQHHGARQERFARGSRRVAFVARATDGVAPVAWSPRHPRGRGEGTARGRKPRDRPLHGGGRPARGPGRSDPRARRRHGGALSRRSDADGVAARWLSGPGVGHRLRRFRAVRPGSRRPHDRRGPRRAHTSRWAFPCSARHRSATARTTRPSCSECRRLYATTRSASRTRPVSSPNSRYRSSLRTSPRGEGAEARSASRPEAGPEAPPPPARLLRLRRPYRPRPRSASRRRSQALRPRHRRR